MPRIPLLLPLTGLALLAGACGHQQPPPPCKAEPLRLSIEAAPQVNLDEKGKPLPTTLRIYQLKDTAKLETATFDDLLDHDKDTIGPDLVGVQEVVINPAGTFWRLSRPLPPGDPEHCRQTAKAAGLRFYLEENRVENR
jgi:type VI secretion system VasD/TssJ family lipoprotein